MAITTTLVAATAQAVAAAAKLYAFLHNPATGPTSDILTDQGNVPSLSKIAAAAAAAAGAGVVPFTPPVPWSTGLTAVVGPPATAVTYLGASYYCNTGHLTGATFAADAAKWTKFAAKGEDADVAALLTTNGDMLIRAAGVLARLAAGTAHQVLGIVSGLPAWKTMDSRAAVNDAAYTILATDTLVAMTAITAARIFTLPAASSYPVGRPLVIKDESRLCSSTLKISLAPTGAAKIDNSNTTQDVINYAGGRCVVYTDGTDWFFLEVSIILETVLGAPVAMTNGYTTNITVAQGTVGRWMMSCTATVKNGVGASNCTVRLYDGTTTYATGEATLHSNGYSSTMGFVPTIVGTPSGSMTFQSSNPSLGTVEATSRLKMERVP